MSSENGLGRSLRTVLLIFVMGAGLGFAWRQGWVPVELLPARTGTLDPAQAEDSHDLPLEMPAPLVEQRDPSMFPEPPDPMKTPRSAGLTDLDREIFAQQQEPSEGPEIPMAADPPQRLPTDASPMATLQPYRRTPASGVQAAGFTETASEPSQISAEVPQFVNPELAEEPPLSSTIEGDADVATLPLETLFAQYDAKLKSGEVLAAHRILSEAYWKRRSDRAALVERLDRSAATIFFQAQPHFVEPYVIEPGDRLEQIAAHYHVTWEYLSKLNRVDAKRIQAGRRLKVVRGPFSGVVELDDYSLTIHLQGYYVRRFPVGIGRDRSSPIGRFAVLNKVVNPQYTDPDGHVIAGDDPANPLGERWIDLGNSYGIHGTIEPDSIGSAASRGCVRLGDKDIVNVYDFLTVGSEVVVRP